MTVLVTTNYTNRDGIPSHHYQKPWSTTDYFCPGCGQQSVWLEDGDGDYYQGPTFCCTTRERSFSMPSIASPDKRSMAISDQLRTGITAPPEGKAGA